MVNEVSKQAGCEPQLLEDMISEIANESMDTASRTIGQREGLSGNQVFNMVNHASDRAKTLYLAAVIMGYIKGAGDIVKAIRNGNLK